VVGGRQGLADCGIPIQSIVGMRAPFLEAKPEVRVVLKNNGFLYDRCRQLTAGSWQQHLYYSFALA
jgi:hypothetical protein